MSLWFLDSRHVHVKRASQFAHLIFIRDVPPFDSLSRPGRFPEECEAGFYTGVVEKTADWHATSHLAPAISLDQFRDDGFQRNPVQRVARMGHTHDRMTNSMELMDEVERLVAYSTNEEPLVYS